MGRDLLGRHSFGVVRNSLRHLELSRAGAYALVLCFLAITTQAGPDNQIGTIGASGGGCRDADPGYECTHFGDLTGTKVIRGSLLRCASGKLSNTPAMKSLETNRTLFQFTVSRPSEIAIEGSGLQHLVVHSGTSLAHPIVGKGMDFESRLAPGHYTLVGVANECSEDSLDEKDSYRIEIKAQASDGHAGSDKGDFQPSESTSDGMVDKTARVLLSKWVFIGAGVILAWGLLVVLGLSLVGL